MSSYYDAVKMGRAMGWEPLFGVVNKLAIVGWLALLLAPILPRLADLIASYVVPLLLSVAYGGLILAFWSGAEGGFDSLANVMRLFGRPEIALAGWLHYLAFDLFIGAWEVRTARDERIAFALVVPCLALTFLFGPIGYLAFQGLRGARALMPISRPVNA